jgi:spermidine synthase
VSGDGYDLVLLGKKQEPVINVDELQERLNRADHATVVESLHEAEFRSAVELLASYIGRAADLEPWLRDAQINRDRNLRLQYLAGTGLNSPEQQIIYRNLVKYRRFPEGLFVGTTTRVQALRSILQPQR